MKDKYIHININIRNLMKKAKKNLYTRSMQQHKR